MVEETAAGTGWRETIGRHQSALTRAVEGMAEELSASVESGIRHAVTQAVEAERSQERRRTAKACEEARRGQSEALNQALRRLRVAVSEQKTLELLDESCTPWASRCAVLVFSSGEGTDSNAHAVAWHGLERGGEAAAPLSQAPAITAALESREPLITLASADQLSATLAASFNPRRGDPEDYDEETTPAPEKAYLFPLLARDAPVAMLIAGGAVEPAQVELLCEAAAMRLEALARPASGSGASVSATPASATLASATQAPAAPSKEPGWEDLTEEDQRLHLQAQRTARVRVAEMRLYDEDAVRLGVGGRDLYGALTTRIDDARREFLQSYLSRSTTMVDYLHLEMLRSLAGGNAALFGAGYPGPLV